jgi:hypothetical protein
MSSLLPLAELQALEISRRSRVLVYCAAEPNSKGLDSDDVHILYQCLRGMGRSERLDVVLHTGGGMVHAARRIALLLREFTDRLSILVPFKARSAGTLLCLGADELVMGPLGELSPLDTWLGSTGEGGANMPRVVSAEDIRAFYTMAETWLRMDTAEHKTKVFEALAQRFFPTTLSGFFRADQYVRKVGEHLLRYHLPRSSAEQRHAIVDRLIREYPEHSHSFTRAEVAELGLVVKAATDEEEPRLWEILQGSFRYLADVDARVGPARRTGAVLFTRQFGARYLRPARGTPSVTPKEDSSKKSVPQGSKMAAGIWEVFSPDAG